MKGKVEVFNWHVEWAYVENSYGKLLTYNLPRYNQSYATGTYQKSISDMIRLGKYDVFLDVGAYVGYFSLIASHYCKEVIAYEAHPFYYGVLLLNMRNLKNVQCEYKFISCLGDTPRMSDDIRGLSSVQYEKEYKVPVSSLDNEVSWLHATWKALDYKILIKMDIEGSEEKALSESNLFLRDPNVHWIIDVHTQHGVSLEKVMSYFKGRKTEIIGAKVLKVEGLEK